MNIAPWLPLAASAAVDLGAAALDALSDGKAFFDQLRGADDANIDNDAAKDGSLDDIRSALVESVNRELQSRRAGVDGEVELSLNAAGEVIVTGAQGAISFSLEPGSEAAAAFHALRLASEGDASFRARVGPDRVTAAA